MKSAVNSTVFTKALHVQALFYFLEWNLKEDDKGHSKYLSYKHEVGSNFSNRKSDSFHLD